TLPKTVSDEGAAGSPGPMSQDLEVDWLSDGSHEPLRDQRVVRLVIGARQLAEQNELVPAVEDNNIAANGRVDGPLLPAKPARKQLEETWAVKVRRDHHAAEIGHVLGPRIARIVNIEPAADKALAAVAADQITAGNLFHGARDGVFDLDRDAIG